jgi:aldehyde:ferredoxin oxidoreductase
MNLKDSLYKVLHIDLTKKSFRIDTREELFNKYLGGTGVATQLLLEECPAGIDPLSPENPIILAISPLTGVYPFASKTVAMFKSPHTGNLGESHAGGRSAIALRMAGYGAIVVKGKSDLPIYISIEADKVYFRDAATLWGIRNTYNVGNLIRDREKFPGLRCIMLIGQAGENLCSYASVVTETFRHFGRLGLGAVFGSKMLKGIAIAGKSVIDIPKKKDFTVLYKEIFDKAVESSVMKKYHDLGTAGNILPLNLLGALPTRNLLQSKFEGADKISGEAIAEKHLGRRVACSHCPTGCVHLAAIREPYEDEPYFYKTSVVAYDYELLYALGSMIGISDSEELLKLIDKVDKYCFDIMTMGVVLSWATEMFEKKLITLKETGGLELKWGEPKTYGLAVEKIIDPPNDFYKALSKGVVFAAEIYGGKDFALAFGKNEMAGYHTGPAAYLGFLLGARHSHLDNAGYSLDQTVMINEDPTPQQVVDKLISEESFRQIMSSCSFCFFARGIYNIDLISRALLTVGIKLTPEQLLLMGKEIYLNKYKFKFREGFEFKKLEIPLRITETKDPTGKITLDYIKEGISYAEKVIKPVE